MSTWGLTRTLGQPFAHGWLGHNGARYAHIARNYARDGLLAFRGAPRLDVAAAVDPEHSEPAVPGGPPPQVYAHHPPGLTQLLGLVFRVTGPGEDAARVPVALSALVVLLLLARLAWLECGPIVAGGAALALAAQPMHSIYGAHVDVQGAPVLALSLATLLGYRRWLQGGSPAALLACAAVASWLDWFGLYAPAFCALHLFVTRPGRRRAALGLAAFTLALFAGWLAWLSSLPGQGLDAVLGSAGVRAAGALEDSERAARHLAAWWRDTAGLMPGWPLLLPAAVLLALGRLRLPPTAGTTTVLGPRALLALLLVPPLLHAAAFPAGLVLHDYWLFGLPPALALAVGLLAARLRPAIGVAAVALLLLPGWRAAGAVLQRRNELPALVGRALAGATAPGDVILTNFDCTPLVPGGAGDERVDKLLEVLWASDRTVRGLVGTPGATSLEEALARRPDAAWFLLTPWPPQPLPALAPAVAARAEGPPRRLSESPPVELWRLRR